jgi:diguanylate cyclase (GGDEF)-like protein
VSLDIATLFVVTVFIMGLGGLLLLFSWFQNRETSALGWWGLAFLVYAPATALFGLRGEAADVWSIQLANALLLFAYGMMWSGTRAFEEREPLWLWAAAGAGLWLVACQFDIFLQSLLARILLASVLSAAYSLLFVWELWQGRHDGLMSRWPTMGLLGLHAALFLVRIAAAPSLPFPLGTQTPSPDAAAFLILVFLFYAFSLVFLLMALTKERAELNQKRAAAIDPLTGIPNRRGFSERAERVVARCQPDGTPLTLLVLDLDNFKSINDRYGHRIGDAVLVLFSQAAVQSLRPLDLFGRIGGEEFVALLPGVTPETVMEIAERIRDAFAAAARQVEGYPIAATVSIGTASSAQTGYDFDALYASADAALYRAKQKGRNRIELGRPVLTLLPDFMQS